MNRLKGIDKEATPHGKGHKERGSIPARIVKYPTSAGETPNPFDDNPTLKGFKDAVYPRPEKALPVRPFGSRMHERGPVGAENAMGQSQ